MTHHNTDLHNHYKAIVNECFAGIEKELPPTLPEDPKSFIENLKDDLTARLTQYRAESTQLLPSEPMKETLPTFKSIRLPQGGCVEVEAIRAVVPLQDDPTSKPGLTVSLDGEAYFPVYFDSLADRDLWLAAVEKAKQALDVYANQGTSP
jgi:hypothetical protein